MLVWERWRTMVPQVGMIPSGMIDLLALGQTRQNSLRYRGLAEEDCRESDDPILQMVYGRD